MPNFTRAESIAFNHDLNEYMKKEVEADKRAERVEQAVKDMTAEGGDFFPFTQKNFEEALAELTKPDLMLLNTYVSAAYKNPDNQVLESMTVDVLKKLIVDYWKKIARQEAEQEYDRSR